jgi:hypothetical protein
MGGALWAVVALAGGLAVVLAVGWLHGGSGRIRAAVGLGVVGFLVLGALIAPALDFYVACRVGAPLAPLRWLTGGASC